MAGRSYFAQAAPSDVGPTDIERILALPRREPIDCSRRGGLYAPAVQALVEVMTARYALPEREHDCRPTYGHPCITELNAVQSWILREAPRAGGVVGLCSVGSGKSLAGLLAPLAFPDCKVAVLLAEPSQRQHYRSHYLRLREHFRVPSIVFVNDDDVGDRRRYIASGAPVLHFVPYSQLSQASSTDLLERLAPDLIIADEVHRISSRASSRTMRFLRYMARRVEEGRPVRFLGWSGTLVNKSVRDQAHVALYALGEGSPMPLDLEEDVEAWAAVMDPSRMPDRSSSTAKALQRAFGAEAKPSSLPAQVRDAVTGQMQARIREGFRVRLVETPGVISTIGGEPTASIYGRVRPAPSMPEAVRDALVGVRRAEEPQRPDGEPLVEATEIAACARNVGAGFYHYWRFPEHRCTCGGSLTDPCAGCALIYEWYDRRKPWLRELRGKLLIGDTHLDSPLLCARAAARFWNEEPSDLPRWAAESWPAWAAIKDRVPHEPRVRWIDDFLARDAAAWALENRGIVWYQSDAFGRKVAEIAGLPCHGGGPEAEARILAEKGDRSVVASIKAHGSGRDGMQRLFRKQLVAEIPSSALIWEQLLGRLCRRGQEADSIELEVYLHVPENREALRAAIQGAEFIQQTTGNVQLLGCVDWEDGEP